MEITFTVCHETTSYCFSSKSSLEMNLHTDKYIEIPEASLAVGNYTSDRKSNADVTLTSIGKYG